MKTPVNPFFFIFLLFFAAACSKEKTVQVPNGILSKEAFAKVLVDFALAESAANTNVKNVPVMKIDSSYAFNPLKENKVSKATYDSTIAFYSEHIQLYKEVYELVLTELGAMQTHRDSLKTHPAAK